MELQEHARVLNNQCALRTASLEDTMSSINNEVVAGIDVHKAMLAVVIARPGQNETEYVSRKCGAGRWQLKE